MTSLTDVYTFGSIQSLLIILPIGHLILGISLFGKSVQQRFGSENERGKSYLQVTIIFTILILMTWGTLFLAVLFLSRSVLGLILLLQALAVVLENHVAVIAEVVQN